MATFGQKFLRPFQQAIDRLNWTKRANQTGQWRLLADRAAAEVETELPRLEQKFVTLGERLEPVSVQGLQLVEKCESLLRLAAGVDSGDNIVQQTLTLLQGPLAYIDHCVLQRERLITLLTACEAQTGRMIGVRAQMQATLAPLTYISVLFKIESARLPTELREAFVTVTVEIERMRQLVDESISQNTRLLQATHETLRGIRQKVATEFERVAADAAKRRARIEEAVKLLDEQMHRNASRDLTLTQHSTAVRSEVSRIVENLQFQDIVHQKCKHVTAALGDPTDTLGAQATLQAGQLEAVVGDLAQGREKIAAGLRSLGEEAAKLESSSSRLDDLHGMTAAADGIVQLLLEMIGSVREIMVVVTQLTEGTAEALQPMDGLAEKLSSTLTETAVNMNLIALNAQIRSVINGSGTGLEQLSARTAVISSEVTNLSTTNTANLGELAATVQEMIEKFKELRDSGSAELRKFDDARGTSEGQLHAVRDQTLEAFQTIGDTIAKLRDEITAAEQTLAGLEQSQAEIAHVAASLRTYCQEHPLSLDAARQLAAQAASYTMASEKAVLARTVGGSFEDENRDLELFDAPAPDPVPARTAPPPAAVVTRSAPLPVAASVPAPLPPPRSNPPPASPPPASDPAGSNVEFF